MISEFEYLDIGRVESLQPPESPTRTVHTTLRGLGFVVLTIDLFEDAGIEPVEGMMIQAIHDARQDKITKIVGEVLIPEGSES